MKECDKLIIKIFLFIIYFIFLLYPVNYLLERKGIIKIDNSSEIEDIHKHGLIGKLESIKSSIENKTTNYFPFYSLINQFNTNMHIDINTPFYKFLNKEFLFVGTNYDNEYIYKNINSNYYILKSQYNDLELYKKLDSQIKLYNELAKEKLDIYVYLPSRYEFIYKTELDTKNMSNYIEYFKENINNKINLKELSIENNYHELFYKTDHHWTGYGALKGYSDIMEMMNIKPVNYEVKKIDNTLFSGSMAKSAADTSIKEDFYYIDAIVTCKTNINDRLKPMKKEPKKKQFYDYYVGYYYGMFGEVSYDCNSPKKDNVLILGDSFSWSIDYLIAKHFNKTYVVNLKFLDKFDYKNFINKNNIKKVIIINETATTLFDAYNYDYSKKVGA